MSIRCLDHINFAQWLDETELVALAEAFGGTRLYIPKIFRADHPLVAAIGMDRAAALSADLSPDQVKVPLLKDLRAKHYRQKGMSNAQIAVRLTMTESGVEKMMRRIRDA